MVWESASKMSPTALDAAIARTGVLAVEGDVCDVCGAHVASGDIMLPVNFATGSTGWVGECCAPKFCIHIISDDGMVECWVKRDFSPESRCA